MAPTVWTEASCFPGRLKIFGSNDRVALLWSSPLVWTPWKFQVFQAFHTNVLNLISMNCADRQTVLNSDLGAEHDFHPGQYQKGLRSGCFGHHSADHSTLKCQFSRLRLTWHALRVIFGVWRQLKGSWIVSFLNPCDPRKRAAVRMYARQTFCCCDKIPEANKTKFLLIVIYNQPSPLLWGPSWDRKSRNCLLIAAR